MLNAKNGRLSMAGGTMDYIRFGTGHQELVIVPGVGDGFQTVKGAALPFALLFRRLARDFTVYVFSRRNDLAAHTTTREMAEDLSQAMTLLSLDRAGVVGISQGGMIAQWLAIDHPEQVERLVLTVTAGRPNPTMATVIGHWLEQAKQGDYRGILLDSARRSYSPKRLRSAGVTSELLGRFGKPKCFDRFIIQAESCLTHDAHAELKRITCPTLVIGGTEDGIVTGAASEELAAEIPGAQLFLYTGLSHGLYEEAPDFLEQVCRFCARQEPSRANHKGPSTATRRIIMHQNVIFCYSGTGNCLDLAKNIARGMGGADIIMMRSAPEVTDVREAQRVGFVFPCYGGSAPEDVLKHAKLLQISPEAYTFAVSQSAVYPGTGLSRLNEIVPLKYWRTATHHCSCIWLFPHKVMLPLLSVDKAQKRSEALAAEIAREVLAGTLSAKKPPRNVLNVAENKVWPLISGTKVQGFKVSDACIGCGQCVRLCPRKNIQLINNKVVIGSNCAQCLGCLQYCPQSAISIGRITDKREHYHNPNVRASDLMEGVIHME